jgi:tRNA pseudouridine55 synthase
VLPQFTGPIEQIPPVYSALKIDGKAAYARTRAGEELEMKSRSVTVYDIKLLPASEARGEGDRSAQLSGRGAPPSALRAATSSSLRDREELQFITLSATVSKGTYIRSLARDIAQALGTVGHVTMLRRTKAGPFSLDRAISLDFLSEAAKARQLTRTVMPLTSALDDIPALPVTPDQARLLRQGQRLAGFPERPGLQLALLDQCPVALVEASADGLKVVRGFNI